MNKKICLIYNFAQHYRTAIFKELDVELNCSFFFGDKLADLKKIDYNVLVNFKKELKNIQIIKPIYWQKGAVPLIFKEYDIYIILGEYYCISTWILLLVSKFTRKRIFLWSHGWYGNETTLKKKIKRLFFKLADVVLLYGNYAKNLMIQDGFNADKLMVIYNSLDYKAQLLIRNQIKKTRLFAEYFKNDFPVIIFIGRLTRVKKLEQLIQAFKRLSKNQLQLNLVIVGEGSAKGDLIRALSPDEMQNTWFFGECYEEIKIAELIYNSAVCVSPGNVGLTAMHSLVYGTPVITHDNFCNQMPEFEAIIPNKTGDFFKENDIDDLASTIQKWLLKVEKDKNVCNDCYEIIDKYFNPNFQLRVVKAAIAKK